MLATLPDDVIPIIIAHLPWWLSTRICKWPMPRYNIHVDLTKQFNIVFMEDNLSDRVNLTSLVMVKSVLVCPLQYPSLTALDIGNALEDFMVSSLVLLPQLVSLTITNNKHISNDGISHLTNLRHIYCNDLITDCGVANMNLWTLGAGINITNATRFTELSTLYIKHNIEIPIGITRLHLTNSNITESELALLTNLHTLSIAGNTRVKSLSTFTNLQTLTLLTPYVYGIPRSVTKLATVLPNMHDVTANSVLVVPKDHVVRHINGKKYVFGAQTPKRAKTTQQFRTRYQHEQRQNNH